MGGNALGRQANRLTLPQHRAFSTYCKTRLEPFFKEIHNWRDIGSKSSHGDLDLLCEFEGSDLGMNVKGTDEYLGFKDRPLPAPSADSYPDNVKARAWVDEMCAALDGVAWARNGRKYPIISFGVECKTVGFDLEQTDEQKAAEQEPFWQVDLDLVIPETAPFCLLSTSYGDTLMILSYALKVLSPALNIGMTNAHFKFAPFLGIPAVHLHLTSEATRFCEWLGLNYQAWLDAQFGTEVELWEWLADVPPDSPLAKVWTELGGPRKRKDDESKGVGQKTVFKTHKKKLPGLFNFLYWLRRPESKWSGGRATDKVETTVGESTEAAPNTVSAPRTSEESAAIPLIDLIDPESPRPLNDNAAAALAFWNLRERYDTLLAERQVQARYLVERRRLHLERQVQADPALERVTEGIRHLDTGSGVEV